MTDTAGRRTRAGNESSVLRRLRRGLLGLLAVAGSLAVTGPSAHAAFDHSTVEATFSAGAGCASVTDIAVAESSGTVYAVCEESGSASIRKFDLGGNPVNFSASVPYIAGNAITETPSSPTGEFADPKIAVDNSSAHNGLLYVASDTGDTEPEAVDIFNPSGAWAGSIAQVVTDGGLSNVDVGDDGLVYVFAANFGGGPGRVSKYDTAFHEFQRLGAPGGTAEYGKVDSTGAVWLRHPAPNFQTFLDKFEADQFTSNLNTGFGKEVALDAQPSPFFSSPLLLSQIEQFDVDPSDDDLYVNRGDRIETFSPGTAEEASYKNAPVFGIGSLSESEAVAVTADHHVYASTAGGMIVKFGPGNILPDVKTFVANVDDVGHDSAVVRGRIDPVGGADITDCHAQYGKDSTYLGPGSGEVDCLPDPSITNFTDPTDVSATLTGLETGATYHFRFIVANANGQNVGIDRTVVPAYVLKVKTLAATDINENSATLNGSLDPDSLHTTYHFDYGIDGGYGLSTPELSAGDGSGVTPVSAAISGLPAGKTWHYRLVATNANGRTRGPNMTFRSASPPDVTGARTSEVTATSAILQASINPAGYSTEYHFEYGTTRSYGQVVPLSAESIGSGTDPVSVAQQVNNLTPGVTYHFRVVATNQWGTTRSSNTTFDFSPPSCPNDHVRQQTGASYLPDCRAYELVSPPNAGAVVLFPSQQAVLKSLSQDPGGIADHWAMNTGRASSPSRFAFFAGLGSISGLNSPNGQLDMYVTTRTTSGWVTTLPGLTGSEAITAGRKQCSESLAICLDHNEGDAVAGTLIPPEEAPHVFSLGDGSLGQLPTNVTTVPGGRGFVGAQRPSGDFSHFLFSSRNVSFAPGGRIGGIGSAYDNDLADRTVTIVSKHPDGTDISQDGQPSQFQRIEFPAASPDGSHILMQTLASGGPAHLYMRVDQSMSYDIARGAGVRFVGMTRSGSKVFFIAKQQLTLDDTDASTDLYMWNEGDDRLTRLSKGNGAGDTDNCAASWIDSCDVAPVVTERGAPHLGVPGMDDVMAEDAGDVYFYSPELLDGTRPGVGNQRNLYVYRHGIGVRLVAPFDPGTDIRRMQISADGDHAALLTTSRLTSYDSHGFRQMYTYDAETRDVRCASCNPSGIAPTADVEASQGGRFMADDGRTFFATHDALVSRDTDGTIIDVYEYVGGRPQLITSGIGSRDNTGGGKTSTVLFRPVNTGLEAVSRDGVDVYFSTYDSLISADQNGEFVKFYNARTAGGFASNPELGTCAAADECHGPDSSAPAPPVISTSESLGTGGNQQPQAGAPAGRKRSSGKKAKRKQSTRRHKTRPASRSNG